MLLCVIASYLLLALIGLVGQAVFPVSYHLQAHTTIFHSVENDFFMSYDDRANCD